MTDKTKQFLPLATCPFCNSPNLEIEQQLALWHIECLNCFCHGPRKFTADCAVKAWNDSINDPPWQYFTK